MPRIDDTEEARAAWEQDAVGERVTVEALQGLITWIQDNCPSSLVSYMERCSGRNCDTPIVRSTTYTRRPTRGANCTRAMDALIACRNCGECNDCCSCHTCQACDNRVDSTCDECEYCGDCCECIVCRGCNTRYHRHSDYMCSECNHCTDCCSCSESCPVDFFSPFTPTFHAAKAHERKSNSSRRYVAAEIEIASASGDAEISSTVRRWGGAIVEDGSLPDSGFEINTAPASGDKFVTQVEEICRALRNSGAEVTADCGLHVHVDARDLNYYDIRRLIRLYAVIEPALFEMVPPSRKSSTYCVPCGPRYLEALRAGAVKTPKDLRKTTFTAVYDREPNRYHNRKERRHQKYDSARYAALNLHSWYYRGTIECRMFNGTADANKIIAWGMLWAQIIDYVATHIDKDIDAIVEDVHLTEAAQKRGLRALKRIVGPELHAFINTRLQAHGTVIKSLDDICS